MRKLMIVVFGLSLTMPAINADSAQAQQHRRHAKKHYRGSLPPGQQKKLEQTGQLPPGQAKKLEPGYLPPGQQKKLERTGQLPPGQAKKLEQ